MTHSHAATELLRRLLNPEDLGWSVSAEVRALARRVLREMAFAQGASEPKHSRPKLYIAGPMSGLPEFNHPAFLQAARDLRACGYEVFCPAQNGLPADAPWERHMRVDLMHLMQCDAVALLPGWQRSRGARLETLLACELGLRIQSADKWMEEAAGNGQPTLEEKAPQAALQIAA